MSNGIIINQLRQLIVSFHCDVIVKFQLKSVSRECYCAVAESYWHHLQHINTCVAPMAKWERIKFWVRWVGGWVDGWLDDTVFSFVSMCLSSSMWNTNKILTIKNEIDGNIFACIYNLNKYTQSLFRSLSLSLYELMTRA